jgi:hypothetical protein
VSGKASGSETVIAASDRDGISLVLGWTGCLKSALEHLAFNQELLDCGGQFAGGENTSRTS